MLSSPLAAIACVLLLASPAAPLTAGKKARPMTREEVAQTWVGLSEDELYLVRLVLRPDGTGTGGYVFADREPRLFRVDSWSYRGRRIAMTVAPLRGEIDLERLEGVLAGDAMTLTMAGRGWSRRLFLRPEGDLERRWNRLREGMAAEPGG